MTELASLPGRLQHPDVQHELAVFWQVYEPIVDDVQDKIRTDFADDPVLGPIIEATPVDDPSAQQTLMLMREGFTEGRWEPYMQTLREQGLTYGDLGLKLPQWHALVASLRSHVTPQLIAVYEDDPAMLSAAVQGMGTFIDLAMQTIGDGFLASREQTILKQQLAIAELSTPVLTIRPGLLLLPIVGILDTHRSRLLTEGMLEAIGTTRARVVVMDITGVAEVDTEVANRLVYTAAAAQLMGATPVITGISAGVAQTLVSLGIDLAGLRTIGDLQGGVEAASEILAGHATRQSMTPAAREA